MKLTDRDFDKLLVYMMADVALERKAKGLKLNYPKAVAVISAVALDGARAGSTIEEVSKSARGTLTTADVMDGVADLIPVLQVEAVFTAVNSLPAPAFALGGALLAVATAHVLGAESGLITRGLLLQPSADGDRAGHSVL